MSVCSSGSPEPQPSAPATIVLTAALAASFLPEDALWVVPFLAYLGTIAIDTSAFCAAGPTAFLSAPSVASFTALLTDGAVGENPAAAFIEAIVTHFYWFAICQCSATPQPVIDTAPTEPTDIPSLPAPSSGYGIAGACYSFNSPAGMADGTTGTYVLPYALYTGATPAHFNMPEGATSVEMVITCTSGGSLHNGCEVGAYFGDNPDGSGNITNHGGGPFAAGTTNTVIATPNPTNRYVLVEVANGSGSTDTAQVEVNIYCGGATGSSPSTACCAPDPNLIGMLTNILGNEKAILALLTPTTYVIGTAHAGLTGDGQFDIGELFGVSVAITTLPGRVGEELGNPNQLYDVGWINVGSADGWQQRVFLDSNPFLYVPNGMGAMTMVGYSLTPGVVVTVTELNAGA